MTLASRLAAKGFGPDGKPLADDVVDLRDDRGGAAVSEHGEALACEVCGDTERDVEFNGHVICCVDDEPCFAAYRSLSDAERRTLRRARLQRERRGDADTIERLHADLTAAYAVIRRYLYVDQFKEPCFKPWADPKLTPEELAVFRKAQEAETA